MSEPIDADDLAMMSEGFTAAMTTSPGPGAADGALFDLGWAELIEAAPSQGAAMAFTALGATGAAAGLLDDVVARAIDMAVTPTTCVVLPEPHTTTPPATRDATGIVVSGIVSPRIDVADTLVVPIAAANGVGFVSVDPALVRPAATEGIDPGRAYRRVSVALPNGASTPLEITGSWESAVVAARVALADQLIGGARWMLAEARQHAVDRVQFGHPIAAFQAVRHKLAESLVAIEGAASIAAACTDDSDPLLAALAKSQAGAAAKLTAKHAQQVLAGIGFTTDHQFHLWLKRMLVIDTLFGSATSLPTEIGQRLLARGGAPRLVEL